MNTKTLINTHEITRHESFDRIGYVFTWKGRVYRAIYPQAEDEVMRLWNSGLFAELIELGLFPDSHVTDYKTSDSNLVLEHQKVDVITYPYEWSFHMLKDAAIATLRVNQVAGKYGYQTIDAHGFNIAFHKGRPLFIDLGSLIEIKNDFNCSVPGWRPYHEFMRSFYAPLRIWSKGEEYFARHSMYGEQLPMVSYWRYVSKIARLLPKKYLNHFEFLWYKYKGLNTFPLADFLQFVSVSKKREKLGRCVVKFARRRGLPFSSVNLERLTRKISAIRPPNIPSAWADYHSHKDIDDRHRFVINAVKEYRPTSVLDMAGNAGFFSSVIADIDDVQYVICADYDSNAIDRFYTTLKNSERALNPVVMNFSVWIGNSRFPNESDRLKADMVMALALTHHLLLTQYLTIDFVMSRLKRFARKYVVVEFMPLGLYSPKFDKIPDVPQWYTLEWFRKEFQRNFTLLVEKEIDTNRIIFIGKVEDNEINGISDSVR